MKPRLKKLADQVIVITGATSGIGLTTARRAAQKGAKLVLVARNEDALKQIAYELTKKGSEVIHVVCDVGIEEDVERVSRAAVERFGGFDTWVNNAGISIFGRTEDVSSEDHRRLFQTNFWGIVYGSLAAVKQLKKRGGGAIINLGSEVSDRAVPLQAMYSASKHAVKGFTDALRVELEEEGAPIAVTLIKPAAIDTMFVEHAKNYLETEPQLPPPVYAPEIAADAILYAAEHVKRDLFVGGGARMVSAAAHFAPRVMDVLARRVILKQQQSGRPARDRGEHSLYAPRLDLKERQGYAGRVFESSLYTKSEIHPGATAALFGATLALFAWWHLRSRPLT